MMRVGVDDPLSVQHHRHVSLPEHQVPTPQLICGQRLADLLLLIGVARIGDPAGRELYEELNRSEARGRLFVERSDTEPRGRVYASDNRVIVGYEAVRKRLALYKDGDGETRTRLYISPCCKVTFRQLKKLHYAKDSAGNYTEEQDKTAGDDHGADCVRYAVRGYEWWWNVLHRPPATLVCAISG